jgi:hypothetical protein
MPRTRNRLRAHTACLLPLTTLGVTPIMNAHALANAVGSMATVAGLTVSQERP